MFSVKEIHPGDGPLLIFGGVYSNFQALERMQEIARERGMSPNQIICTGDVVAYCAQPEDCVQAVKDWGVHVIAGNVEINLRDSVDDCGCNFNEGSRCDLFSRQWYPYAQSQLSPDAIDWMKQLPDHLSFRWCGKSFYVLHGSYFNTSEFIFQSTPWSVKQANFDATGVDVILSGHCGLPFEDCQNEKSWLNAGVIGMPANDGTPRVWYMLLTPENYGFSAEKHAFSYDFATAQSLMELNKLPREYSKTLSSGIWDNCEILPAAEAEMQGVAI